MLWYDDIIDYMLLHPGASIKDCATALKRTPGHVATIANSDMFRARFEERRKERVKVLAEETNTKLTMVVNKGLDVLLDKLERKADAIPIGEIADLTDKGLERLGYGVRPQGTIPGQPQMVVQLQVSQTVLLEARANLRRIEQAKLQGGEAAQVVDGGVTTYEPGQDSPPLIELEGTAE